MDSKATVESLLERREIGELEHVAEPGIEVHVKSSPVLLVPGTL